ncbi:hypothetical protein J2Z32_001324 [Paenibacillus turicensis]|uniref:Suppressor of fused-like domain-containing protein n=1 Tax=Paenibacillus turicensis TaxID=160487 RepID=A0ABS4FQ47_9BACL|nr:suppressor of fused domain protein [Paenibacillus turicensis]MBP1904701.1 hypothetical protein [Paenibacillus turicensis]
MTDKHDEKDNVNANHDLGAEDVQAPGWDAIDETVHRLYGDQQPKHYGTMIPYMLGGEDPLDGISVFEASAPFPHWHFVTYGFSELYEKESSNLEYSGYGFELTFRLRKNSDETEPPAWALNLLQNMGRYVFQSGNIFRSGDYLNANGPICLGSDTELKALAYISDPQLPPMETPNGQVEFIQMVGITLEEFEAMHLWSGTALLQACEEYMPLWITDLDRSSLMSIPAVSQAVEQGILSDGSSTGYLFIEKLSWKSAVDDAPSSPAMLTLGANQVIILGKMLQGRILKGRNLTLSNKDHSIVLEPGEQPQIIEENDFVRIILNHDLVNELLPKLQPITNQFTIPQLNGLLFNIEPSYIKDQDGNVIETIG